MNTRTLPPPSSQPDPRIAFFNHHAHGWDDNPHSNANILHRLTHLRGRLGLHPGLQLLEVGCGTGFITGWLCDCVGASQVTAIDFSCAMLDQARAKGVAAAFQQLDICQQSPADAAFDLALCFQSFPHFRDPRAALINVARSLRQHGRLMVLHLVGSQEINRFHRHVGGAVGGDLLPARHEWPELLGHAGLRMQSLEDRPDLFLLEAVRV